MSRIEKLIQELCPDGVELKELEQVVYSIKTGLNPRRNFILNTDNSENYYVTVKEITSGKIKFSDKTDKINDDALKIIQNRSNLEEGDVLFSGIGTIGKVAIVDIPIKNWNCSESVFLIKPKKDFIISKYLMYILNSDLVKKQYESQSVGSTLKGVRMGAMSKFQIPIPPLPIQQEIVSILDKFTQLGAELEAELGERKKQYEYYSDQLLQADDEGMMKSGVKAEWKRLGEIGKVSMCKRVMKHETSPMGDIPFYKIGTFGKRADAFITKDLYEDYKSRFSFPKVGDILISASGTIGRTVVYDGKPAYFQDSNIVWIDNDESIVSNDYLFYYYKTVNWIIDGGTISRLYNSNLAKTKILIPPLSEQNRIVSILDKFDTLVNDTKVGLPAEIAARQKQYEYYRAKLLDFKEKQ